MKNLIFAINLILITVLTPLHEICSNPVQEWLRYIQTSGKQPEVKSVFDNDGNIIIAEVNFLNVKRYSGLGKIMNMGQHSELFSSYDLKDIFVSSDNNVFLLVNYDNKIGNDYMTLYKLYPDLNMNNTSYFSGDYGNARGISFAESTKGNIYVAVEYVNRKGENTVSLLKYSKYFQILWQKVCSDSSLKVNKAVSVICDQKGFVYIAGISNSYGKSNKCYVKKFTEEGKELWTAFPYSDNSRKEINSDKITLMKTDHAGNIYIFGKNEVNSYNKVFTIKINESGVQEWNSMFDLNEFNLGMSDDDNSTFDNFPVSIETDNEGNVITVSNSTSSSVSFINLQKITVNGLTKWTSHFKTPDYVKSENKASGLSTDKYGNVFITGYQKSLNLITDYNPGKDIVTIKYSPEGELLWHVTQSGSGDTGANDDEGKELHVNDKGEIFVTAGISSETGREFSTILKYVENYGNIASYEKTEETFKLNENFPNPFNPSTKISFEIPEASNVTLKVFDITGREVASLINGFLNSGIHEISWNASELSSGVYFYRIQAGSFTKTKKMHLIK